MRGRIIKGPIAPRARAARPPRQSGPKSVTSHGAHQLNADLQGRGNRTCEDGADCRRLHDCPATRSVEETRRHIVATHESNRIPHDPARDVSTSTVFTLTSGRSGTLYLCALLRRNAPQCKVEHETYVNPLNPSMFGRAIYDHATGRLDSVRALLRRKRSAIEWSRTPIYVETSHAFLKSYWDLAPEFFPSTKVIHLIRHPLEVARSEANREQWLDQIHLPFRSYGGCGDRRYRRWALTELEPIFGGFDLSQLTLFQRYLIQWIEIENRAMDYLQRFDMHSRCLTLHSPEDLNSPQAAAAVLEFIGVPAAGEVSLPGVKNRTPGHPTTLGKDELHQCRDVVAALPARYLEIFRREPYAEQAWAGLLDT